MHRLQASIIIPAHNEEAVIGRCLRTLLAGSFDGEHEVIVVCNACDDRTAEIARGFPGVRVEEIDEASKHAALDLGDAVAKHFPRVYLDADVQLSTSTLVALVDLLIETGIEAAAPGVRFDTAGRPWTVRRYFEVFQQLPSFGDGYVGSGLFALSEKGRQRFSEWPRGLPDDGFVARLIPQQARRTSPGEFTVTAPATLRAQFRRSIRVQGLNRALERHTAHPLTSATTASTSRFLLRTARDPRNWSGVALVGAIGGASRVRARIAYRRGRDPGWIRDESIRSVEPGSAAAGPLTVTGTTRVDVVAVTYNSGGDITGFLDSLSVLDGQEIEVVVHVIDNASADDTVRLAASHPRQPRILQSGDNLGYAGAINKGLQQIPMDSLVLVANPDTRLQAGFLQPLLEAAAAPDVGVVSVRLVDSAGAALPSQRREPAVHRALAEALLGGHRAARLGLSELVTSPAAYRTSHDVDWAVGALLAITPAARAAVGPWEDSFFLYSEETEYLLRVRDAGLRVRYEPRARAFHRGGASHSDAFLWSTLACNQVRLFRSRHGAVRSAGFYAAKLLNEVLRAPRAPTHRRALRELVRRRTELLASPRTPAKAAQVSDVWTSGFENGSNSR